MRHRGFEPRTTWLKVKCSTDWANTPYQLTCSVFWKCPEPESNQWHRDFQSLALPTELSGRLSCGGRIWTYDLRVMSPTSYRTAPPRDIQFNLLANCFQNGWRRIRTFEVVDNRFTVCPLWPLGNPSIRADDRTRTDNLLITNQLLCQLSHIGNGKWGLQGSNLWPSACKADALPAELRPHILID